MEARIDIEKLDNMQIMLSKAVRETRKKSPNLMLKPFMP